MPTTTTTTTTTSDGATTTTTTTTTTSEASAPPAAAEAGFAVRYEIRAEGSVAGKGIFAVEPIPRGALLWRYSPEVVVEHDEASLRARLKGLAKAEIVDLLEHIYVWDSLAIEILDDAKVWNHAPIDQRNTGNHPDEASGEGDGVSSYALRDIAADEELTDDYATFHELPWFEALCAEFGASSCLSVGREHR